MPRRRTAKLSFGSPGRRFNRNHSTSIGELSLAVRRPEAARTAELRPSAAITTSARTSRAGDRTPVTR
ncbi:Uncharacterised protein [Mycobacteroides abscessus subsp. abscessus]|nr:Uncharacterised protein [Mycobacteroides abscessus subsp. abscessus]